MAGWQKAREKDAWKGSSANTAGAVGRTTAPEAAAQQLLFTAHLGWQQQLPCSSTLEQTAKAAREL